MDVLYVRCGDKGSVDLTEQQKAYKATNVDFLRLYEDIAMV